jgi:hypothetical protein
MRGRRRGEEKRKEKREEIRSTWKSNTRWRAGTQTLISKKHPGNEIG